MPLPKLSPGISFDTSGETLRTKLRSFTIQSACCYGSLPVEAVFLPAERSDRDSRLRQREDRAGLGDAAQDVLAKRDQRHCRLGRDRA